MDKCYLSCREDTESKTLKKVWMKDMEQEHLQKRFKEKMMESDFLLPIIHLLTNFEGKKHRRL